MPLHRIGIVTATTIVLASAPSAGDTPPAPSATPSAVPSNAPSSPPPNPPKPPACVAPEFRQFDFWLGDWDVRDPAGKLLGQNRIVSAHKGCVLLENYRAGEFSGSSLNVFDVDRGKWHQTWVDSGGGLLVIEGGIVDGRIVLTGATVDSDKPGVGIENRISWQPLHDGRVRQLWETSTDKGRTWTTSFDGYYTKQIF